MSRIVELQEDVAIKRPIVDYLLNRDPQATQSDLLKHVMSVTGGSVNPVSTRKIISDLFLEEE